MKPILFNSEMVNAILQGRKTQTRRIIKTQPDSRGLRTTDTLFEDYHGRKVNPPYRPGDILYVRESFRKIGDTTLYKASAECPDLHKWKPSIHMPKEAARIFLKVKSVRAERLCDIGSKDAIQEGVSTDSDGRFFNYLQPRLWFVNDWRGAIASFETLWQSINGEESWDANPWVWVIEFEQILKP